jgi:hypothetical protein
MSAITLRCPGCNARVKAPTQLLGTSRPCPGCSMRLRIRIQSPPDCAPLLVSGWQAPALARAGR